ncbi:MULTISPECIES: phosphoenolpyruvate synthase [unclassified Rhodococcus (in: high G+C Gram-positive bacteria)]|uniref:phosphoenolpyruvate synthase n=1 Tax=unclassified Rhodococcus (in: high G+C Gram-positive bacteria) TaxID=192944 RepID=UPI0002F69CA6|nr:phosphoenolpyruvate synthase [Rhodococcus sp. DK17]
MNPQQAVVEHRWVTPIDQLGLSDAPSVGGKAANLGELTRARYPVPAGFAVTAEGYLQAMDEAGVRDTLREHALPPAGADDSVLTAASHELQATVLGAPVPAALRAEILGAYRGLGDGSPRVAVRSSAPAEDAADTSFAGIHDSFIGISGADRLIEAITKCWASLWSERALTYRSVQGVTEEPSIAVVVQLMVDADQSGVVFTADPRTGARDRIVVEAATGLGEVVVGGQVEPDTYVVAKSGFAVIDAHIGSQSFSLTADSDGEHAVEIPAEARGRRVLTDQQLERLALLAAAVEDHYHVPQDLEFVFAADRLWIVQTRPITTLGQSRTRPEEETRASTGTVLVHGLGAGPGTASGRVRILRSVSDAHRLSDGEILVAPMTRPDWLPVLRRAAAIVTDGGGITCHAAIVGRELGRPVVVGTRTATSELVDGAIVTVDGDSGVVYDGAVSGPAPESSATGAVPSLRPATDRAGGGAAPEVTATSVYVNLATPDAADRVAAADVDGVGLLRAEFMIMDALGGTHPAAMIAQGRRDEYVAKMAAAVERIAAAFSPRPVIYRAIDLRTNEFADLAGGDVEPHEDNPMIGYRGCFRYVREPELFRLDLDVLFTVRKRYPNVHLMIPFVRTRWELAQCLADLDSHPLGADRRMRRWIMAEVPSVAYWIPEYAALGIDGVSIGTNDLTQLVLGVDRDSEICRDLFDTMDPAVLDAIDVIIERATRAGLTTSLCGQAVSTNPALAEHLVRKGITSVSVAPDALAATRHNVSAAERRILLDRARSDLRTSAEGDRRGGTE